MVDTPLESERAAAASAWRHLASLPWGLLSIAVGIGLAIAYGFGWLMGSHPDATLQRADSSTRTQIGDYLGFMQSEVDEATLEPYEMFRGLQPWYATDRFGNPCLLIVEPSTGRLPGAACTPREADLLVDIGAWPVYDERFAEGLPDGTVLRFHLRGDEVDVTVHRPSGGDR